MDPIDLFPVVDEQTNFCSVLFVEKFIWHFHRFLSEINQLIILPFVWYTQFYGILYHDPSLVKNSNRTQPQYNLPNPIKSNTNSNLRRYSALFVHNIQFEKRISLLMLSFIVNIVNNVK